MNRTCFRQFHLYLIAIIFIVDGAFARAQNHCARLFASTLPQVFGVAAKSTFHEVLATRELPNSVDLRFRKSIETLEKNGASGGWFFSVSPFEDGVSSYFYLLQELPSYPIPQSSISIIKTQQGLDYIREVMRSGVPVVLDELPTASWAKAAAMGNIQLADDAIQSFGLSAKNIILIQPESSKFVIAHEFRHWRDFEDLNFEKSVKKTLKEFFSAKYLTEMDKEVLYQIILEIRGHATQALQAIADINAGRDYFDGVGSVLRGNSQEARDALWFEAKDINKNFIETYSREFFKILMKVRRQGALTAKRFSEQLAKVDLSDEFPESKITFRSLIEVTLLK